MFVSVKVIIPKKAYILKVPHVVNLSITQMSLCLSFKVSLRFFSNMKSSSLSINS